MSRKVSTTAPTSRTRPARNASIVRKRQDRSIIPAPRSVRSKRYSLHSSAGWRSCLIGNREQQRNNSLSATRLRSGVTEASKSISIFARARLPTLPCSVASFRSSGYRRSNYRHSFLTTLQKPGKDDLGPTRASLSLHAQLKTRPAVVSSGPCSPPHSFDTLLTVRRPAPRRTELSLTSHGPGALSLPRKIDCPYY